MLSNSGAAICVEDKDLKSDLTDIVTGLLTNTSELNYMSEKSKDLSKISGAERIAEELVAMASEEASR